ncbi:unnamed protein product [Ceutorhynchus assimilis]|uniref:serine--tRNA ligase n=1 Tax=Ceutorhynchus assimilis TaxID=467358 RepID=A0A9N9MS96_9CUCU|nr:unnamed protein product [Ceutorhynchus assimilis]
MLILISKCLNISSIKSFNRCIYTTPNILWNIPKNVEFDQEYLCNSSNIPAIQENISKRKGIGNIQLVNELNSKLNSLVPTDPSYEVTKQELHKECFMIPNKTHSEVFNYGEDAKVVKYVGERRKFDFAHKEFHEITKRLNLVRTEQLGNLSGSKSYYLLGQMAQLEQALVRYFVSNLLKYNYQLVSVPDILPRDVVESCGMNTQGERTQVYSLDPNIHQPDLCLSGTSEIALAGYLANKVLSVDELPLKLCAVSRCYRAETSGLSEERGIYRVHEFTKVEMFIASLPNQSDIILEELRTHQEEFFKLLDIHFQVLDMPPHELGAQAYRKYDIEAWMPGRNMYGEISSCSNCTDFQSRRLNIKYKKPDGSTDYVHTLNGTACAVPRLLIALTETHQQSNGVILIPKAIQTCMYGATSIGLRTNCHTNSSMSTTKDILNIVPTALTIVFAFYGCFHFISEICTNFIPFGVLLTSVLVFSTYGLRAVRPSQEAVESIIGKDLLDNPNQEGYVLKTIAHRGAGLDAPENSLVAFNLCHTGGCDFIEFDVTLTSDGIPIVFHDTTLERMADSDVVVNSTSYEILKNFDISVKHPLRDRFGITNIPTLDQTVIKLLDNGQKMIIDIKDSNTKIVPIILDLFVRYPNLYSNAMVSSFYPNVIYLTPYICQ